MSAKDYAGKKLRIQFDGERCIHARRCVLTLPKVFRANVEGDWIDPDGAPPDEVQAIARRCPSGAITVSALDGPSTEQASGKNVVSVIENGPLAIRGQFQLDGDEPTLRATLCRCGASKKKPYCDGSHVKLGFVSTGEPASTSDLETLEESGPVSVFLAPDGPVVLQGPVEVVCGGTGRAVSRKTSTALCRCGESKNKPFCDGTHAKIGFKTGDAPA